MSQSRELDPVFVNPLRPQRPRARRRAAPSLRLGRVAGAQKRALLLIGGAIGFCLVVRLGQFAIHPLVRTYQTGQEIRQLQATLARQEATNDALRAEVEYLKTPAGAEQEARRRAGWVRPGEVAIALFPQEADAGGDGTGRVQPVSQRGPSFTDRIRSVIETCLAVLGQPHRSR